MRTTGERKLLGLTLIELLIILAVLSILAAIAIPNLQQASVRARIATVKNNLRMLSGALMIYRSDHGSLPTGRPTPGSDPYGVFSMYALSCLTTPIAYASAEIMNDPFGPLEPSTRAFEFASNMISEVGAAPPSRPFPHRIGTPSLLYFYYPKFAALRNQAAFNREGFAALSSGPDRTDSFGVYYPFPAQLPPGARHYGVYSAMDTVYDPTNGTISGGDIGRWEGNLPPFVRPD